MAININITPDDFNLSLCKIPETGRLFWLFHCHSYLANIKQTNCGKPIFLQAAEDSKNVPFPIQKIEGLLYFDVTKQIVNGQPIPLTDSKICHSFSALTGVELDKHGHPLFISLLMVPKEYVIRTISSEEALSRALEKHCRWAEAFYTLSEFLEIPWEDCGLTGSRALEAHSEYSDVDITLRLSPDKFHKFMNNLSRLHKSFGGLFPDKYHFHWRLRVRIKNYEICLFIKYKTIFESCLLNLGIIIEGDSKLIKGKVFDTVHSFYSPTVFRIISESGKCFRVIFPSTEARGVFDPDDYFEAEAFPCIVKEGSNYEKKHIDTFIVIDGLETCPALRRKLTNPY